MFISFLEDEMGIATCPHEDALIITVQIEGFDVNRILIDSRISTDVLFLDALKNMDKSKKDLQKVNFSLLGSPQQ